MARKMKDSGIEWIGEIPEGWETINPKALFSQRKDKAQKGERQLSSSQQYGILYQDEYMALTGSKVVTVEKDFDILKHVEAGDFVISMRSFQGGLEYSTKSGAISSAYVMLVPNLKDDKHANLMSASDIREIATFLECEEKRICQGRDEKSKESYDENQRLSVLLSKIKEVVSEDESENGPLPDSIRTQLTKRFYNASLPSKKKDILLYNAYKNIICDTPCPGKIVGEKAIKEFRNYRNKETHGNYNLLNLNIGITALHLAVAVYCSILHRSGVDDQTLTILCNRKFFN